MLKSWLVRRRDNPYPSRAEKEHLAEATGLTYMQICNWFANWRRKLRKSATASATSATATASGTWGRLIKRYNATACAATAAEQFSISSGDSIWGADASGQSGQLVLSFSLRSLGHHLLFNAVPLFHFRFGRSERGATLRSSSAKPGGGRCVRRRDEPSAETAAAAEEDAPADGVLAQRQGRGRRAHPAALQVAGKCGQVPLIVAVGDRQR